MSYTVCTDIMWQEKRKGEDISYMANEKVMIVNEPKNELLSEPFHVAFHSMWRSIPEISLRSRQEKFPKKKKGKESKHNV